MILSCIYDLVTPAQQLKDVLPNLIMALIVIVLVGVALTFIFRAIGKTGSSNDE